MDDGNEKGAYFNSYVSLVLVVISKIKKVDYFVRALLFSTVAHVILRCHLIAVTCTCLQIFLRAHFSYDPKRDSLIPCREAGLPFRMGEILEVVNRDDPNWWQVGSAAST